MSGIKDQFVSVRQSQVDRWQAAAAQAAQAASTARAIREQQERMEQQRKRDAERLEREIDENKQRLTRSVNELNSNLARSNESIRKEIARQSEAQDAKREELRCRMEQEMADIDRRHSEAERDINANLNAVDERVSAVDRKIDSVKTELEQEIRSTSETMRRELSDATQKLREEIEERMREANLSIDVLEGRVSATERELSVIKSERENARQAVSELQNTYHILLEDLRNNHDCARFCPSELESLERRYEQARNMFESGYDPAAGLVSINEAVMSAMELRARVIYSEGHFDEIKYELLTILAQFESMSTPEYLVASAEEGYLFNLEEMSNGELARFRERLSALRARLDDEHCGFEELASIREDIKQIPGKYDDIVTNAVLFESASEEVKTQSRRVVDELISAGFRFEGALLNEDQSTRVIVSCAAGNGLLNRLVIDVVPVVEPARGTEGPTVGYRYRQRVFVIDGNGEFVRHYDPSIVQTSISVLQRITGGKFTTAEGMEGVAAGREEYRDVAESLSRAAAGGEGGR